MPHPLTTPPATSFLASYRLPAPAFKPTAVTGVLRTVWQALAEGALHAALTAGRPALPDEALPAAHAGALRAGLAWAQSQLGLHEAARRLATDALQLVPDQALARRVLAGVLMHEQDYAGAAAHLAAPVGTHAWDAPLTTAERHVAAAACAWHQGDWEQVLDALRRAYPAGIAAMPPLLQEDWLRLAFYRDTPDAAAEAAGHLVDGRPLDDADVLLQTLVRQGWTRQALPLYRTLYRRHPESELLRRRLVGLALREGAVEEARRLMERGALPLAV